MKIGIIAAMQEELGALLSLLHDARMVSERSRYHISTPILEWHYGRMQTAEGQVAEIVALQSGVGKSLAALYTGLLLERHELDYLINIGSAGGLMAEGQHGDIVLADSVAYHDADVRTFGYRYGQLPGSPEHFPTSPRLRNLALEIANEIFSGTGKNSNGKNNQAVLGQIVSGDSFIECGNPHLQSIQKHFPEALAVEMEAAAIAHIAFIYGCPCLVVRSISDFPLHHDGKVDFQQYLPLAASNAAKIVEQLIYRHPTVIK